MKWLKDIGSSKGIALTAVGILVIAVVGFFDSITGPEVSLSPFYLGPICLITWYVGRKAGIVMVMGSIIAWFVADRLTMDHSHTWVIYWNTAVRAAMFVFVVLVLSNLRDLKLRLEQ